MRDSLIDRKAVDRLLLLSGAIRSGLIDALGSESPHSVEEVAGEAGADPRATRVVLEALVAEGVVERVEPNGSRGAAGSRATGGPAGPQRYRLSPLGRGHLLDEGPDLERSGLLHLANRVEGWLDLPEVIRTGKPLQRDPARLDVRSFVSAMGERDPEIVDEIVDRCLSYAGNPLTMIDIGGAVGHVTRAFSRRGVRATLLDREAVMPIAREYLGDDARDIVLAAGDFNESLPPGPYELAYLGNVFHIYGPEACARLAVNVHRILAPGGTIAIQDYVWGRSPHAAIFAVNMLQATEEGGVWTELQYEGWLAGAGFVDTQIIDLGATQSQLVLARKEEAN